MAVYIKCIRIFRLRPLIYHLNSGCSIYTRAVTSSIQIPIPFPSKHTPPPFLTRLLLRPLKDLQRPPRTQIQQDLLTPSRHSDSFDIPPDAFNAFATTASSTGQTDPAHDLDGVADDVLQDDARVSFELGGCAGEE